MMNKLKITISTLILVLTGISALAQQNYPKNLFVYALENRVSYQGKAPKISDFITAFLDVEETDEMMGNVRSAWEHYLRHEPQNPCVQLMVDEKNGYLRYTFDARLCEDFEDLDALTLFEMCYWNCADGKHKLIAVNVVSMMDGKYIVGQYSGINYYLYDNATRQIWIVSAEDLNAEIEPAIDEANYETGELMTMNDETVVVCKLPQQGKDINVDIYHGNRKTSTGLLWDGMRFKRR